MLTTVLLVTGAVFAGMITFLIGLMFIRSEDNLASVIGMLIAVCSAAELIRESGNDQMLAITYVQNVGYAVAGGTLLMFIALAFIRRHRSKVLHEVSLPRPQVQYYEKWEHPPGKPPRSGHDHGTWPHGS